MSLPQNEIRASDEAPARTDATNLRSNLMAQRNIYISVSLVEREISALLAACPELADDEALRADMVEGETDLHGLLSRITAAILDEMAMQVAIKARLDSLKARSEKARRREDAMRSMALRLMEAAGLKKAVLPEATVSRSNSAPAVIITDEAQIPADFQRVKVEIDKAKLREALKSGSSIPGATLNNGGETLTIRVA